MIRPSDFQFSPSTARRYLDTVTKSAPATEIAKLDSLSGSTAYVNRPGDDVAVPVLISAGVTLTATDATNKIQVIVLRNHGSLNGARIIQKA